MGIKRTSLLGSLFTFLTLCIVV